MGQATVFLAGIVLAASVFAAWLWSLAQAVRTTGALRWGHLAAVVATVAVMGALSLASPAGALAAGAALAAAGLWLALREQGWGRLFHLIQAGCGIAVASGLPFGG